MELGWWWRELGRVEAYVWWRIPLPLLACTRGQATVGLLAPTTLHNPSHSLDPHTRAPPAAPPRSAIRDMLRTLRDPYSRFVSPQEFSAMLKYDVSGVGLNLGTAEEFVNKTVGVLVSTCKSFVLTDQSLDSTWAPPRRL